MTDLYVVIEDPDYYQHFRAVFTTVEAAQVFVEQEAAENTWSKSGDRWKNVSDQRFGEMLVFGADGYGNSHGIIKVQPR